MAPRSRLPRDDESGPPPERLGPPVKDLHPTMDARFVLVEIGKLTEKTDAHTRAIERHADKLDHAIEKMREALDKASEKVSDRLDKLTDQHKAVDDRLKTWVVVGRVLVAVVVALAGAISALVAFLWPFRHKLMALLFH